MIAWATGDVIESVAIIVVLIINALVGFATEWQAGRALDALRRQARATARVRRDGYEMKVDAADLVPGDAVILNAGDRVPADARLIKAESLRVEESALTGESTTVEKSSEPAEVSAPLGERHSMVYLSTTITAGHAVSVVTETGEHTELGRIGKLVADAPNELTPLEARLAHLGHRLVYAVLVIAAVVMVTGWLRGDGLWMMAEVAISLAVAAVPEGLPVVTTLILALGVLRMARQNAIVRRLPAVETLGSTSIICTDKTGTLTQNRMTVRSIAWRMAKGSCQLMHTPRLTKPSCSNRLFARAFFAMKHHWRQIPAMAREPSGTHRDSLARGSRGNGRRRFRLRAEYPKIIEVPFDASTKRMITVHRGKAGTYLATLKGAPSVVLDACANYFDRGGGTPLIDDEARARFLSANEEMAGRALRVLGFAEKSLAAVGDDVDQAAISELESDTQIQAGYTFLGFVGMIDPPRPGVPRAIEQARAAGIRVVMLTGDQMNTARAIARELRLNGDQEVLALHARDLEGASHERLAELARTSGRIRAGFSRRQASHR